MKELVKKYTQWLNQKVSLRQIGDWYEITTPFVNHNNDYIQLYAKYENDKILLTDGGDTLNELEMAGVNIARSEKRKEEMAVILNGFGVRKNNNNEIYAYADEKSFPQTKHRLIQSILSIDDMFILAEPKVESFFFEDVQNFFDKHEVRYSPHISLIGRSSFPHQFDFSIPKTKKYPERIIKAINTPRKDTILSLLFSFEDTKLTRPESQGMVIMNDSNNQISEEVNHALEEYKLEGIRWSIRNQYIEKFAA